MTGASRPTDDRAGGPSEIIADLTRAKAVFQLRAIATVMGMTTKAIEAGTAETERLGPKDESAAGHSPEQ